MAANKTEKILMPKPEILIACDCAGTMDLDARQLASACGATKTHRCSHACTQDLDLVVKNLKGDAPVLITCEQEVTRFETLAAEFATETGHAAPLIFADIRDRAGWCDSGKAPEKQAALLAEAALDSPMTPLFDIPSAGTCLIVGAEEVALKAAERLAPVLAVTCILAEAPDDLLSPPVAFDLAIGRLRTARGSFGHFTVRVDGYAPLDPAGRGPAAFAPPRDGASSECDIILDLTGSTPLFPSPEKRDGYLRADPGDPLAVERAVFEAAQLVGTFEKPLYVEFDAAICAHSRAGQKGCTRCLDVCPTGAILPAGDSVEINAGICAGCGGCAAVCPSGAVSYDDPPVSFLFTRLATLASAFRKAGGSAPRLLFHDAEYGAEMIRLSARFGRGLPPDVIPLAVNNVEGIGHAEMLAALAVGFAQVSVLTTPETDMEALAPQHDLALAISGSNAIEVIAPEDPDALENALYAPFAAAATANPILPLGGRREVTRSAATALRGTDDLVIDLPQGAPYGRIDVNTDACTLCLACASLCPVGALGDNPDKPQLNFQETACLQCGICASTCPENAITLVPQLDLSASALSTRVLHEEEPFACIECGTLFGVRSTIEHIVKTLEGKHWMYQQSDNTRLVQMCDDCRIRTQYHSENSPFQMGERPRTRTTDDDLREREKE